MNPAIIILDWIDKKAHSSRIEDEWIRALDFITMHITERLNNKRIAQLDLQGDHV